ncbi:uncharacterized protein LOC108734486 [Agrilus planipennis]|uniref:Uncharacterized protein LOC108734486 n=1 Tax=Agrilus planipennis TaxID=224129 RepID=A0A1W4WNG3_AGRPL|nr:uncharacterized protein LOC108734486 [Agrilus planipennis]
MHSRCAEQLKNSFQFPNEEALNLKMAVNIKVCAIYLDEMLQFYGCIERVYRMVMLLNSSWSICTVGLSLMSVLDSPNLDEAIAGLGVIFVVSIGKTFMYCYCGNRLTSMILKASYSLAVFKRS